MSEANSGASPEEMQKQEFSIFILKLNQQSLKTAEQFLRNRNWKVGTGTGLKEALAYIIQKQPEFIMIAADHPHKKIKILPKILSQAFPVKIIAYAEAQSGGSLTALRDFNSEYTLFPPVSGPAIERIVLKMKRDEEKRAQEIKERELAGLDPNLTQEELIRLKGSDSQMMNFQQQSSESARAALSQLLSGDESSSDSSQPSSNLAYLPNSGESNSSAGNAFNNSYMSGNSGADGADSSSNDSNQSSYNTQNGLSNNLNPKPSWLNQDGKSSWQPQDISGPQSEYNSTDSASSTNDPSDSTQREDNYSHKNKKDTPILEYDDIAKKEPLKPKYKSDPYASQRDNDSIIVKGTQDALDKSVKTSNRNRTYQEIEKTSNCACIVVESERFSGYLVAALGKNRKMDDKFIEQIRIRLFQFLRSNGENVKDDISMQIKLEAIDFEDWAIEQADFLRKSIHDGDEVAMAFFPRKDVNYELQDSASANMLKMDISEIKDDTIVEFDLYIHMPENNKYILYTPEGRTLYGKQRERLIEKGIGHMHLRKESATNVKKYRAQNYLNDKIKAFQSAAKLKEA